MKNLYKSESHFTKAYVFVLLLTMLILFGVMKSFGQTTLNPGSPINVDYHAGSTGITITTCNSSGWTATQIDGGTDFVPDNSTGSSGSVFTISYVQNSTPQIKSALYSISATGCSAKYLILNQSQEGIAPLINKISSTNTNGSYNTGDIIYIDVYYTDFNTINLTGSNLTTDYYLNLNNGAKAYYDSDEAYSSGTKIITFKYTVGVSTSEDKELLDVTSVSLSGDAAIKDAAGNNANQTLPGTNNLDNNNILRIDNTPPTIASITSNATTTGWLKIGNTINFTLSFTSTNKEPGATVHGSYNGQTLTWSTSNAGETYTATYTVIAGNNDQNSALQITGVYVVDAAATTGATANGTDIQKTIDAHTPTGLYSPASGTGIDVEIHPTLTFDEAIFDTDGTPLTAADLLSKISFNRTSAPSASIPFTASIDGTNTIITILPTENLLGGSDYTITMDAGKIADIGGNMNELTTAGFTTEVTNVTNTTKNSSYPTIQAAFTAASANDVISLLAGTYNELALTLSTVDVTLKTNGIVSIDNLTVSGSHIITLDGNLTMATELNLSAADDKLAIGSHTLTLNGALSGSGYLHGSSSSNVTVAGSGTFGSMNVEGVLNTLTIDRAGETISLGNIASSLPINTLNLTDGDLELAFNSIVVSNYSRSNDGRFIGDDLAGIEMTGSAAGALVFGGTGPFILGTLKLTTSASVDVASAITIVTAEVLSGILTNSQPVTYTNLYNSAVYTMNADVTVDVSFSSDVIASIVNVNNHTLTLNGEITNVDNTYINAGATSSLVFNGATIYNLPATIAELNNLTINRTNGVSMAADLDVKGVLTLTSGDFTIGANKLTINKAISGTLAKLKSDASSTLAVTGTGTGIQIPALGSLNNLILANGNGAEVLGTITINNQLTLTSGELTGSGNIIINDAKTIERSGGSLVAAPVFGSSVNINYTGSSAITTGFEIPAGTVTTDVIVNNGAGVSLGGNRTINNLTLTNGNFAIGANALTFNGNLTVTSGQLIGGTTSNLTLGGTAAFNLPSSIASLKDLNINRSGGVSLTSNLVLEGILNLTSGNFNLAANRLTLKKPIDGTSAYLITTSSSSITIDGIVSGIILPSTVTNLNNLTLNNANGTSLQGPLTLQSLTLTSGLLTYS